MMQMLKQEINQEIRYDVVVIGAGPAGLSAAIQVQQHDKSHIVLEAGPSIAGTIQAFSKGKWIMAEPITIPKRSALNFEASTREDLLEDWQTQIDDHALNVRYNSRVEKISGTKGNFTITLTTGEEFFAQNIIMAFGVQGRPNKLSPEIDPEWQTQYYIPQDADWEKKRILVLGSGDSAVEEALMLSRKNKVIMLNRGDDFGRCKGANKANINEAIKSGRIICMYHSQIKRISSDETGAVIARFSEQDKAKKVTVDIVLARIGTLAPSKVLEELGLTLDMANESQARISEYGESSIPGLYLVGSLSGQALIKQGMNQGMIAVEHLSGSSVMSTEMMILDEKLTLAGINVSPHDMCAWVQSIALFSSVDEGAIRELLMNVEILTYETATELLKEGDHCEHLYIVAAGVLNVTIPQGDTYTLSKGEVFGEIPLLTKQANNCLVNVAQNSVLFKLPQNAFGKLLNRNETAMQAILSLYLKRTLTWLMFADLPEDLLNLMLKEAELKVYNVGDILVDSDTGSDKLYLIVNGTVGITEVGGKEALKQGGYTVGLRDAIRRERLTAQVRAMQSDTLVWELPVAMMQNLDKVRPEGLYNKAKLESTFVANPIEHKRTIIDPSRLAFFEQENLGNANNVLVIDKNKCVGCDHCETACASTHDGISRLNRKAGVKAENLHIPTACRHCKNPGCLTDCPADAIHRTETGEVLINDACIGCGNCASNCPYDVISMAEKDERNWLQKIVPALAPKQPAATQAVKCDLCAHRKDGPACVQACPTGAAQRIDPAKIIQIVAV